MLEIGPGHGVAASLVLAQLRAGSYVGVDRSQKMIDAAMRRLGSEVRAGRARFHATSTLDAPLPDRAFDRAFAMRVRDAAEPDVLRRVARALRIGGLLVLSFDDPGERARTIARTAERNLAAAGFDLITAAAHDGVVSVRGVAQ